MTAQGVLSRPTTEQLRLPLERTAVGEAFVVSDSNAEAARVLAGWPDGVGSVLALHGPAGSGKSRLAADWAERVGAVPLNGTEAALVDPLELEGRPILLDCALDADDESLFHLINLANSGGGALLLVSRAAPRQWSVALPDLRSRLDAMRTVAMEAPDDVVLSAILRARFAERSIAPADEVIDYLVRRLDRSADTVAVVVERLDAQHRPVTRVLARQVLDQMGADQDAED
jgi:chromosomal replication initiation ATPase DnaA